MPVTHTINYETKIYTLVGFRTLWVCVFFVANWILDWKMVVGVVSWDYSVLVPLFLVFFILSDLELCNGGITSSYVRNDDLSLDMPLDSDVFRVPPGYNAPQQVCFLVFHLLGFKFIYVYIIEY